MCQICLIFATFAQDKPRSAKLSDPSLPSFTLFKHKISYARQS